MHRYMMISAACPKGTMQELEQYARSVADGYRPPLLDKWPPELRSLIAVRGEGRGNATGWRASRDGAGATSQRVAP